MRLVAGATGYVGGELVAELARRDVPIRAMARDASKADDLAEQGAEVMEGDVLKPETLGPALEGIDHAYYLVHSMGRGGDADFAERDREGAVNFGKAAAEAGVTSIVYLGGLAEEGSKHLESRHATAGHLAEGGVPVTYFQAAAVIGGGSESFLTVYFLVKRLPVMITPSWTKIETQPIAIADVIAYLAAAPENEAARGKRIEIGGPDKLSYGELMDEVARGMRKRPRPRIPVPFLTPWLSSQWIGLVTPVDSGVAKPLIEGLAVETFVRDTSGMELFDVEQTPLGEAVEGALAGARDL
jgi:uncharacterized protein YbjT (DUF2867 family)